MNNMGKSEYIKGAELRAALGDAEDTVKLWITGATPETYCSKDAYDKILEYQAAWEALKEHEVEQERQAWQAYAKDLRAWALRNGLKDTMEAGMTEPNPPHYERANDD